MYDLNCCARLMKSVVTDNDVLYVKSCIRLTQFRDVGFLAWGDADY